MSVLNQFKNTNDPLFIQKHNMLTQRVNFNLNQFFYNMIDYCNNLFNYISCDDLVISFSFIISVLLLNLLLTTLSGKLKIKIPKDQPDEPVITPGGTPTPDNGTGGGNPILPRPGNPTPPGPGPVVVTP